MKTGERGGKKSRRGGKTKIIKKGEKYKEEASTEKVEEGCVKRRKNHQ